MTAEHGVEEEKSDKRWHASLVTKVMGVAAVSYLGLSLMVSDLELKRTFASLALICGGVDGVFLATDAILDSVAKRIRKTPDK